MNFLRSKRGVTALVVLIVILFLFRPGVYRLRNRIAISIGTALGRRVAIDNVRFRILPQPGFDLEGLVIYDDPEFSAEPMIRAQDVSASIRFRSLFRGRLEIASLSASEPSINLVRNESGRWNFASLIERNAQIPAAPTEKRAFERRPAFPYLEASHARVNFKIGQTKKSYALMDSSVGLWQDSEDSWSARIKAAPVRTDFNLTDTGVVSIEGKWQRASNLRFTPLQFTVQWQNGQLGQITKLISGKDRGWRGAINLTAQIGGTPEGLSIRSHTTVEGFHRYDIAGSENLRLATSCSAQYNSITGAFADVFCDSPVGTGNVRIRGTASIVPVPTYDLTIGAQNVPVASLIRLLREAKKQVPEQLSASGLLNAEFRATRVLKGKSESVLQTWKGTGSATDVLLSAPALDAKKSGADEIAFATIPLAVAGQSVTGKGTGMRGRRDAPGGVRPQREGAIERGETNIMIGPVTLALNSSAPLSAGGRISKDGYTFFLRGDTELRDLFRLENMLGVHRFRTAAEGFAKFDVDLSGRWQGFAPPVATGSAQLRNTRAEVHGLNPPVEIATANIILGPDTVTVQRIFADTGATHWSGGIIAPRHCTPTAANIAAPAVPVPVANSNCVIQFDLTADRLSTADLDSWFSSRPAKRPWYRIMDSTSDNAPNEPASRSSLLALQARGKLHIGQFSLKNVDASQVFTQMELDRGKINLTALRGQILQGTHQGNWTIDVSQAVISAPSPASSLDEKAPPNVRFRGAGTLHDISLDQIGTLMHDPWISGTADANFVVEGSDFHDVLSHCDGKFRFLMRNGSLPHIEFPGSRSPLPVRRFAGQLDLKNGEWKLSDATLETHDGTYQVSGRASSGKNFDFTLTSSDEQSWTVTGTLADPRVTPIVQSEAKRAEVDVKLPKTQLEHK